MRDSFLGLFHEFKTILCLCPKCNNFSRLSDLHLRSKDPAPKTWLDEYDSKTRELQEEESEFAEEERKIRDEAAERGRAKVPLLVKQSMDSQFAKLSYDPYDIKALLHPVEFVVFNGMNSGSVNNVVLLSRNSANPNLQILHRSASKAIEDKKYEWKIARVDLDGNVEFE